MNHSLPLLEEFVCRWREAVERDEPIAGSDAVEYLVEFYADAKKAVRADRALARQVRQEQRALDL
jgi:hypothetical protein